MLHRHQLVSAPSLAVGAAIANAAWLFSPHQGFAQQQPPPPEEAAYATEGYAQDSLAYQRVAPASPPGGIQPFAPSQSEPSAPLATYNCLLRYSAGACTISGPLGVASGASCHCRFFGRVKYGQISAAAPHQYTCLVAVERDLCTVSGPAGVASGTDCFCELPGKVE